MVYDDLQELRLALIGQRDVVLALQSETVQFSGAVPKPSTGPQPHRLQQPPLDLQVAKFVVRIDWLAVGC